MSAEAGTAASGAVEPHRHSWVEGPHGHSVCESCDSAYSPAIDLRTARGQAADLQRRIERTVAYACEVVAATEDPTVLLVMDAVVKSLRTPCVSGDAPAGDQ